MKPREQAHVSSLSPLRELVEPAFKIRPCSWLTVTIPACNQTMIQGSSQMTTKGLSAFSTC